MECAQKVLKIITAQSLSPKQASVLFKITAESSIINWQKAKKIGILGLNNKPKEKVIFNQHTVLYSEGIGFNKFFCFK